MQRATPWFVGPAIHGARAAQLFLRSRAHSRERARCAHTGAQQIDAQRSRLIAHSLSRLECRLPLMAGLEDARMFSFSVQRYCVVRLCPAQI